MAKKLIEIVRLYLERAREDEDLKCYPLEQKGVYEVISGSPECNGRYSLGYYEGRFVDVVAKAVQMPDFAGWWCDSEDAGNCNNGYVKLMKIPVVKKVPKIQGLAEAISTMETLEKQKSGLEAKLKQVKKKMGKGQEENEEED